MIKIERKATPHTQEAMDDLQEACNTGVRIIQNM